jgi:mRNA interferase YafQ
MKRLFPSTQYRKDYKRYRNNPIKVAALKEVLDMLANEQPIPAEYLPHPLHGNYKGCIECHIQGDFLLIWFDPKSDIIELVRLGSHSELFGKQK